MSLSSLRSFTGAASLATTAFDTARTTLKAMAEAAVPPAGTEGVTGAAADTPGIRRTGPADAERQEERNAGAVDERPTEAERTPAQKRKPGLRQGTVLDAYA